VLTGGILGIVGMRIVVGQVMVVIERYPAVIDGAFVIIAWVGLKLLIEYLHGQGLVPFAVPQWFSLSLIVTIFALSLLYARRHPSPQVHRETDSLRRP
jgi:predicted tellurium resistance membrane protein TerC